MEIKTMPSRPPLPSRTSMVRFFNYP